MEALKDNKKRKTQIDRLQGQKGSRKKARDELLSRYTMNGTTAPGSP